MFERFLRMAQPEGSPWVPEYAVFPALITVGILMGVVYRILQINGLSWQQIMYAYVESSRLADKEKMLVLLAKSDCELRWGEWECDREILAWARR